jgi:hypothetical protein
VIPQAARRDAGAFLSRLLRLDAAAVVRLVPGAPAPAHMEGSALRTAPGVGSTALWGRVPFGVLVVRGLPAVSARDVTVRASELLDAVRDGAALPASRDEEWRWLLPPSTGRRIEEIPAAEVRRVAAAAAQTARTALGEGVGGRAVGSRRVRDALLDHVPIVVETPEGRVDVPQRLVQGVIRMNFVGAADGPPVGVRRAGPWVGLAGAYGAAWYRPIGESLNLHVQPYRTNG